MALFMPGITRCAVCKGIVQRTDEWMGTLHYISDRDDPFGNYSDAMFHLSCYLSWPQRDEFERRMADEARKAHGDGPKGMA